VKTENPNIEIRNPKQYQNPNVQIPRDRALASTGGTCKGFNRVILANAVIPGLTRNPDFRLTGFRVKPGMTLR
jgi:hypothetical protein